ncbi:MAG: hypothetical protein ABI175_25525 [Polyangiales bacterium]
MRLSRSSFAMVIACGAWLAACRSRAHDSVGPIPSEMKSDGHDAAPAPLRPILQRFPLRPHTTWTDRSEVAGRTSVQTVEERWLLVDAATWDVAMVDRRSPEAGLEPLATRFTLRGEGIFAIGTRFEKTYDPYDAPHLWLPADAHVGQTWKETHAPPAQPLERACRIDANRACTGGLAVECRKTLSTGEITVQTQLFCEGVGWTGYSVTELAVDGKTIVEQRAGQDVRDLSP